MTDHGSHLRRALGEATTLTKVPRSLDETLRAITRAAGHAVPGLNHVSLSVAHRDGAIETKSGTDQLVWDLDDLQYSLREGPCYDSIRGSGVTIVPNAVDEQRWPTYVPRAVERGLQAQLAVGLYSDREALGGMNLYSTTRSTITEDAVGIAELFAAQAAIALVGAREGVQMREALQSRTVIGQAIGLVMQRYGMDEERAFRYLVRASSTSNTKLRDVAAQLVHTANEGFTRS